MAQAEASGIVDAGRRELFHYTDWCYNVPQWFPPIWETRILRLPNSSGLGKVTHYTGRLLGRDMEWDAQSVEWHEDELWRMQAVRGMPAKMNMHLEMRFETVDARRTKVTCRVGYHAAYPLVGAAIDRFVLRKEAARMAQLAIEGLQKVASQQRVPAVDRQFEKRKADLPGYEVALRKRTTLARAGA